MSGRATPKEAVPWRSSRDAARYVGLGRNEFNAAVRRGEVAYIDDGGHRRFMVADLDAYMARKRRPARPAADTGSDAEGQRQPAGVIRLPTGMNRITGRPFGEKATR